MSAHDGKTTHKPQQPPHTPGQTEGNRKGLDDAHASQSKTRDHAESRARQPEHADEAPTMKFDEGERRASDVLLGSNEDGLRAPAPVVPADPVAAANDEDQHTQATMPPDQGRDPKRNTL